MGDVFRQNRVSAVVWTWMAPKAATSPDEGKARVRKLIIQLVVMLIMAPLLAYKFHARPLAAFVLGLAGFLVIAGLFFPRVFDGFQRAMTAFGRWVGVAMTWLLLVPFFYLVFVPARVLLAIRGNDPMKRKCPTQEPTYWIPKAGRRTPESYRRQF